MNSSPYLFFLSGQLLSWPESFVCSVLLNLTQVFFLYTCFQLPFAKAFILESQYCECLLFPWNSAQFHCTQLTSQGPLKSSLFEMHHQGKQFSHLSWKVINSLYNEAIWKHRRPHHMNKDAAFSRIFHTV